MQVVLGLIALAMTVWLIRRVWNSGAARSLMYLAGALAPLALTYFGWSDQHGGMWVAWPFYAVGVAVLARQLELLSRRLPAHRPKPEIATWATSNVGSAAAYLGGSR